MTGGISARQDCAQGPGGEGEAGGAGRDGQDHWPDQDRNGEHDGDEHDAVERGDAYACRGSCAAGWYVSPSERCGGEQADHGDQRYTEKEAGGGGDWPGPGPAGDQCCRPASADHRSGGQQPAGSVPGRAQPGEGGHDYLRRTELGHRSTCGTIWGHSLPEVVLTRLVEPIGQLLDHRRGQLRGQGGEVVRDQAGLGHGLPSRATLITAAKSCQSARLPDSARDPADVSLYSRLRRPATTDQDPTISPACSRRRSAG